MSAQHAPVSMTLIQRQDKLVAELEPVHRRRLQIGHGAGGWYGGTRSRLKHRHIEEMIAAGYSRREAAESAQQCDDVAYRNADYNSLMVQLQGGVA